MSVQAKEQSDFKARPYQDLLLTYALKQNTIVYLPTGAGKTYIALMAMMRMKNDLNGSLREGGKRSIFVANTQALTRQQCGYINDITGLNCKIFTGDMDVDNWKQEKWKDEFEDCQVVTATCQIILDVIRHGYLRFDNINLIVFDECHHAKKEHPMNQLMALYHQNRGKIQLPRVIGLTGLLITTASPSKVITDLEALERTFGAHIATVKDINEFKNVLLYSTKPKEMILSYYPPTTKPPLFARLEQTVEALKIAIDQWHGSDSPLKVTNKKLQGDRTPNIIKSLKSLYTDFVYQLNDLGLYGASIAILSVIVDLELKKRSAETKVTRNLVRYCITISDYMKHLITQQLLRMMDEDDGEDEYIMQNSSDKVQKLLLKLAEISKGKKELDLKCLVFVERRLTAKNLYYVVKHYFECKKDCPLLPDFMVGQTKSMPDTIESALEIKWNKSPLDRFKHDKCNLIVASSVLEEGIDVQKCNYVIAYDNLKTIRSYIQTKGRARMETSEFIIMMEQTERAEYCRKLQDYARVDAMVKEYIRTRTIDRVPHAEEIKEHFADRPKPFTAENGAVLEMDSAIALLNRYVMTLPWDSFTQSSIDWELLSSPKPGFYSVSVRLPLQSTVKHEIISDPMPDIKSAKRSAAFKACIELYHAKELNDHLLPISSKKCIENVAPLYFSHWDNFKEDDKDTAGTKKVKRNYDIVYPEELCSAMPQPGVVCFLYLMYLKPMFEKNKTNEHIFNLLSTPNHFGILTSKKLPKLASMPLFLTQGHVDGMFSSEPILLKIETAEEIEKLINFHVMIFKDIFKDVRKDFLAKDYTNEDNSYLVVPTMKNGAEIDWGLVRNFQNLTSVQKTSDLQRSYMTFSAEDYMNKVVVTWYSIDLDMRYVVTNVRTDLKPHSPFPNASFDSFADYAEKKYNVNIVQRDQFLLECKPITLNLNRFSAGEGEAGSKKKTKRIDDVILIPELCHNFKFPGDMWLKSVFIPCMLHRLHYLLIAENVRVKINNFLNINVDNYNPKPLIIDKLLKKEVNEEITSTLPPIVNPDDVTPQKKHVKTLSESLHSEWKEYEEPINLDRHINKIYKIELDYYHMFISKALETLHINNDDTKINNATLLQAVPAICDVSADVKRDIKLLNISRENMSFLEQNEILMALTTAKAQDNFNLERLEILGDSFLKFASSFYLLQNHPTWNEGHLSAVKGRLVSNRNLLYHAILKHIPGIIKPSQFQPRNDWQPPLLKVPKRIKELILEQNISADILWKLNLDYEEFDSGICKQETVASFSSFFTTEDSSPDACLLPFIGKHYVSDKTCADVMEALLGVCLKNFGIRESFKVLAMLGILPNNPGLENLLNVKLGSPRLRTDIKDSEVDAFLLNYKDLEKNLGYSFRDRAYLLQALTHPSFPTNRITGCYQQLEFIGDAILDFLITSFIFERCDNITPGKLTDLRSALVNNITLGCLTVRYKFFHHMLSQNASLSQAIANFYEFQKSQKFAITEQVQILLAEKETETMEMADYVEVPKCLGDIFESLVGAVYLDSNNNLETTWNVIYGLMKNEIEKFMHNTPTNIVRRLYESKCDPKFSTPVVEDEVVMVECRFTCKNQIRVVTGFGTNKDQAKVAAAKLALKALEEEM